MAASTPLNINQQDEPNAPLDQPTLCSNCVTTDNGHVKKENAQKANLLRTDLLSRLTSQKPELDKVG